MVAWFIIAIATLAVFGFVAVSGVQNVATTSDGVGRVETVRRLDTVANAIMARAAPVLNDGVVYLPAGQANPAGQGYGVPADLSMSALTPFGQRFIYCPFGAAGGTGTTVQVTSPNGSSYDVQTAAYQGKQYVVGGRPSSYAQLSTNPNLLGWVMAPRTKLSASPSCNQITWDAGTSKFIAPDAIVRALTRDAGNSEIRANAARQIVFYVSPDGAGAGNSIDDPSNLQIALDYFKARLPAAMTINLATGSYSLTADYLKLTAPARNAGLTMQHTGGLSDQVSIAGAGTVDVPGTLTLQGVNFDAGSIFNVSTGRKLQMVNSAVGRIVNVGGSVDMDGLVTLTTPTSNQFAYNASSGTLTIGSSSILSVQAPSGHGILVRNGSRVIGSGAQIKFGTASQYFFGVQVDTGGKFNCFNCVMTFEKSTTLPFVISAGELELIYSSVTFNEPGSFYAVQAKGGARVTLTASAIGLGSRPNFGIYDYYDGAATFTGDGSNIYGAFRCWDGAAFSDSASSNGSISAVEADMPVPSLGSSPTGAQIEAHATALATNARRAAKRHVNSSYWTCNP